MVEKTFKIIQHRYNGLYGKGSIFSNIMIINFFDETMNKIIRREFLDSDMKKIIIEIVETKTLKNKKLFELLNKIVENDEYVYVDKKENKFQVKEYLNNFTITYENKIYYIPLDSQLCKGVFEESKCIDFFELNNEEFLNLINK